MGKLAGIALVMLLVGGGVAFAKDGGARAAKLARWEAVENLLPGVLIEVLPQGQGWESCRIASVSDNGLTCTSESTQMRMVYPRNVVRDVWVIEPKADQHLGRWIAVGVGFVVGGVLCVAAGPEAFFLCGTLVAVIVAGVALEPWPARYPGWGYPGPTPPPPPRKWRRRLVYEALPSATPAQTVAP
jgi:hypothetical protein